MHSIFFMTCCTFPGCLLIRAGAEENKAGEEDKIKAKRGNKYTKKEPWIVLCYLAMCFIGCLGVKGQGKIKCLLNI